MAQQPTLTVSGYRGIWGETLTTDIAQKYAHAFISFVKRTHENPTLLIGRDGRESGPKIRDAIIEVCTSLNIAYIDGDILPTPTVLFAVRTHGYSGAIIITASHNPIEYNGLKFVTDKALFTNEDDVAEIKKLYEVNASLSLPNAGKHETLPTPNFAREHADHILKIIDVESIRARKFKVAVDMVNASACVLDPYLFEKLGVEMVAINSIPNGKFTHKPEPLKENLGEIAELVVKEKCDIGFAQDPDADRLVVIDEKGEIVSEEYTLALGIEAILSTHPNEAVVINMSTSQMSVDIAEKYGGLCIRTKVGEANVVEGILKNNAIAGGEGAGSTIYPRINTARDSFVSLTLILELLSKRDQTVRECIESLPHYIMRKDKMPFKKDLHDIYTGMKSHFTNATINELDGLRLNFADSSWIHLRPSNTEPIIRLIGEAKTQSRLDALFTEVRSLL